MESTGIRDLKENLSSYLDKVKKGQSILVTDKKKQIAVIMPLEKSQEEEGVYRLLQEGQAIWSGKKPTGPPKRIPSSGGSLADAVLEDRR